MFDRLIETQPSGTHTKGRKTYFIASSAALVLFLSTSLVASLFMIKLDLGTDDFSMVELVAPIEMPQVEPNLPEPEPAPKQEPKLQPVNAAPKVPTRQVVMARLDETPREAPKDVSTVNNTQKERPRSGYYEIGKLDSDPVATGTSGRETGSGTGGTGTGLGGPPSETIAQAAPPPPPPPPVKKDPPPAPKPPVTRSMGVINGKATSLPKPIYPAAAKAVNALGQVSVQVLIDERGNVISANAVSGHPLLKAAAVSAARKAQFSPTFLSGEAIKISGVIVYNFSS